ncbi:MAG: group II intron reverse transcriptase/maturase, partial [Brasilonema sp.]
IGLMMNAEKTQITNFGRGFRFLGHGFLENAIFPVNVNEDKLKSALEKQKKAQNSSKKKVPNLGTQARKLRKTL